jgi:hypothetical protein
MSQINGMYPYASPHTTMLRSQVHGLVLRLSSQNGWCKVAIRSNHVYTSRSPTPLLRPGLAHFCLLVTSPTCSMSSFQRMRFLSCLWTHIGYHLLQLCRRKNFGMNPHKPCGIVFGNLPRNTHHHEDVWNRFPRLNTHHKISPKIRLCPKFHRIFQGKNPHSIPNSIRSQNQHFLHRRNRKTRSCLRVLCRGGIVVGSAKKTATIRTTASSNYSNCGGSRGEGLCFQHFIKASFQMI